MPNDNIIKWVNRKDIDYDVVTSLLSDCVDSRQFTNFGPNVEILEDLLHAQLKLDDDKKVIAVCNGACGLNALVATLCAYHNRKLKFAVQSFTFPCSKQLLLMDSIVCDFDESLQISYDELTNKKDEYDGIIITNCFGHSVDIDKYVEFCDKHNKILLFDNAASPYTFYKNKNISNYGVGSIISLHHTKPLGFGEGGIVVIDNKYYDILKKIICFGYDAVNKYNYNLYASNYKMSEISAIFIYQWLLNFDIIINRHKLLYKYFSDKLEQIPGISIFPNYTDDTPFSSCMPVLFDNNKVTVQDFLHYSIEAKKYYAPLESTKIANDTFSKIICFPLNCDMTIEDVDYIINIIEKCLLTNA